MIVPVGPAFSRGTVILREEGTVILRKECAVILREERVAGSRTPHA